MAASVAGVLEPSLQAKIIESKILVVGAGGIGCEVLKNLVMTGFSDIEIVSIQCTMHLVCTQTNGHRTEIALHLSLSIPRFLSID